MNDILVSMKRGAYKVVAKSKKNAPMIMICVGAAGAVTAAVMACRATLKLEKTIERGKKEIEVTKDLYSDVIEDKSHPEYKDYVKTVTKEYVSLAWDVTKLYAPSVLLGAASLGTVFASNEILRRRNTALVAACTTVETAFEKYRANVREAYGEDVDRDMRFGVKTKQVEVTETDKKGKEKTSVKTIEVVTGLDGYSDYAKFFDESNPEWTKDPEYNLNWLRMREKEANWRFKSQGHMFLNEVYDMLGIERTKAGQIVGWVFDPDKNVEGDNYIDFGIYEYWRDRNRAFVNGYENVILLDFNVDGVIVDKI